MAMRIALLRGLASMFMFLCRKKETGAVAQAGVAFTNLRSFYDGLRGADLFSSARE
jgi:hypothetical protein